MRLCILCQSISGDIWQQFCTISLCADIAGIYFLFLIFCKIQHLFYMLKHIVLQQHPLKGFRKIQTGARKNQILNISLNGTPIPNQQILGRSIFWEITVSSAGTHFIYVKIAIIFISGILSLRNRHHLSSDKTWSSRSRCLHFRYSFSNSAAVWHTLPVLAIFMSKIRSENFIGYDK